MNTPHRTLRCAACGAQPQWVLLDAHDPRPTPLCSRCAVVNDRGSSPPPLPQAAAISPANLQTNAARGSSIPTPLALVAVFVASFLPHAAVNASEAGGRLRRAFGAALVAMTEDVGEPVLVAARPRRRAPTPQPMASAPQATVIPIAISPLSERPVEPSVFITRDLARTLPASVGLREGDRITRIDGRSLVERGFGEQACTATKRRFTLEWLRGGQTMRRAVFCTPVRRNPTANGRVVAVR